MKRFIAMLLVVVMVIGMLPTAVFAADYSDSTIAAAATNVTATKTATDNGDGTYTITLSVTGTSTTTEETQILPADVVLVIDTSKSMEDKIQGSTTRLDVAKLAAKDFVTGLLENSGVKVGMCDFNSKNTTSVALTDTASVLTTAIDNLSMSTGTNYTAGLQAAQTILAGGTSSQKFIVFISDGEPQNNGVTVANQLKTSGVTIITVGADIDSRGETALKNISSTDEDGNYLYYAADTSGASEDALDAILDEIKELIENTIHAGTNAVMTDYINTADFTLVDGSASDGLTVGENGELTWNIGNITKDTQTVSFKVTANEGSFGTLHTNSDVSLTFDSSVLNKSVTYDEGAIGDPTVYIAPPAIKVTANSKDKVYDGTALTDSGYTVEGTPNGYTVTATVSGSQTDAGSSNNTVSTVTVTNNTTGKDVTSLFEEYITEVNGTLTVTKKPLTITAGSDEKVYDGTALINSDYTSTGVATGDTIESVEFTGSQTAVGSSNNVASNAKIVRDNVDVTNNYDITYEPGKLTVSENPVEITVTADSNEKTYDGEPLTDNGFTVTGLPTGFTLEATVEGSVTNVSEGSVANEVTKYTIKNAEGEDVTASFSNIKTAKGTLKITPKNLTIIADSNQKVYDGTALTDEGYSIAEGTPLVSGDTIASVTVTGSQTVVGSSDNEASAAVIKNTNGVDITANYNITYEKGTLTVTPYTGLITVTAKTDSKTYDGTPLRNSGYDVTGLPEGFVLTASVTGSVTYVTEGEVPNTVESYSITLNGVDVTSNFNNVTKVNGKLTILQRPITVTAGSDSKAYDGTALTCAEYSAVGQVDGETVTAVTSGSQTVAGTSENVIVDGSVVIQNAADEDVTANYNITTAPGTLTVTVNENTIVITADSYSKTYDGTPLTDDGYTYTEGSLADGDTLTAVVEGSITDVGSVDNVVTSYEITNAAGDNVTASYTIETAKGTLTVNQLAITIAADSGSKVYDGTALTDDGYTLAETTPLANGDEIASVIVTGSQTDVGRSSNVASQATILREGDNVTGNYNITYTEGSLAVTQRPLTLLADSNEKEYDGTALTDSGYSIFDGSLVDGHSITSVSVVGSQTIVGESNNEISDAVINAEDTDVTGNYNITYVDGKLKVIGNTTAITITAASDDKVYDGTELTNANFETDGLLEGFTLTATVEGTITNVGSKTNKVTGHVIKNAAGEDVTSYFTNVNYEIGELEVTSRPITITADSAEKKYDGSALTKNSWQITAGTLADTQTLDSVTITGSQTSVGESANTPSAAVILSGEENVTANYDITYVNGTLKVTNNEDVIVITADSNEKIYDGTPLTDDDYTVNGLPEDFTIEVTVEGSITYYTEGTEGTVPNAVKEYTIKNADGVDVTASFSGVQLVPGTLTIKQRDITITAGSAEKVYDGTPLTSAEFKAEGTAETDTVTAVTSGSQTVAGESTNRIAEYTIKNGETNVAANYKVTLKDGTLKVTVRTDLITVKANSDTKTYDGTPLVNAGYTYESDLLAEGDTLTAVVEGSITDVGDIANVVTSYVIKNAADQDVTASYTTISENGALTVTKRTLIITASSAQKAYDGTPLTANTYSLGDTTVAARDELTVYVEGSQTVAGSSANTVKTYSLMNGETDVSGNYDVTTVPGTLTVTVNENTIVITADSASKTYDGTPLTDNGYTFTEGILAEGDTLTAVVEGSVTDVGSVDNVVTSYKVTNAAGDEVTDSYTITTAPGTLAITKCTLVITASSDTKEYDGTPLTAQTYSLGDTTVAARDELTVYIEGSQTVAGESENKITSYFIKNGEIVVTDNYDITIINGTLKVTPVAATITVTADSDSKVYDGTPLTDAGYTYESDLLAEGDTLTAEVEGSITNVGATENKVVSYVIKNAAGQDVTASYTTATKNGKLSITHATATVTVDENQSKLYGEADPTLTATVTGLAEGDSASLITYTLTRAEGENVGNYTIDAAGAETQGNYKVIYVDGIFRIKAGALTLNNEDHMRYMQGYPDGTFLPNKSMTRAEVAVMFCRLLNNSMEITSDAANPFSDVKESNWFYDEVVFMAEHGILKGYTDGTFRPNDPITRAEFATICTRFDVARQSEGTPLADSFSDVKESNWFYDYVMTAAGNGWVGGYDDGTFRPNNNIKRAEVVTVVNRVLERVADEDYIDEAVANNAEDFQRYSDVATHWAYYNIYEASVAHDYKKSSDADNAIIETWQRHWLNLYTVSYHISGTDPDVAADLNETYSVGDNVTLPTAEDVASMHNGTFLGWALTENAATPITEYTVDADDSYVSQNGVDHHIIHLYAVWG